MLSARRLSSLALMAFLLSGLSAASAAAGPIGSATAEPDRFGIVAVDARAGSSYFEVGTGPGGSPNPCLDVGAFLYTGPDGKTAFDFDNYYGPGPGGSGGLVEVAGKPDGPAVAYAAYCPGRGVVAGWLTPANRLDLAAAVDGAVSAVRDELTPPRLDLNRSPTVDGLVGLDTYYWVGNYRGEALTRSVEAFPGFTITVEANPSEVLWSFGDGATESSGFGTPYATPGRSVTHRYSRHGNFTVTATVDFSAIYRINDGPAVEVAGTVRRSGASPLRVLEAQALIRGGEGR